MRFDSTDPDQLMRWVLSEDPDEELAGSLGLYDIIHDRNEPIRIRQDTIEFIRLWIRDKSGRIPENLAVFISHFEDHGECLISEMIDHIAKRSDDKKVTISCLWAFREIGTKSISAREAIVSCMDDYDSWVRYEAIWALNAIDGNELSTLEAIVQRLELETEPFVIFAGIRCLMVSQYHLEYRSYCKSLAERYYDRMNVTEQEKVRLFMSDAWHEG